MKKLAELKAKREAAKAQALALLNAAAADGDRVLTAEEQARYDSCKAEVDAAGAEIAALEAQAAARREMEAVPTGSPALSVQVGDLNPATTGGFKGLGEFAMAVRNATVPGGARDPRLMAAPTNVHQGGASTGEGYEVPAQFRDAIFEVVTEMDEFGPLVDEEPTEARRVDSIADETTPWGASGVQAYWRGEGTQMNASKLTTEPRSVALHELHAFVTATEELLEDAPRLNARLTKKSGAAIAWKKNAAMVYGSGAGQPLGWMTSAALVTVAKESGQAADTIVAENVLKMFARLLSIMGGKPVWLANSDCLPQLMTMKVGDTPIWMPPNGLIDAPGGVLLGRPVMLTEHAKTVGDLGDLQLINPKGYYALRRESGFRYAESIHLYFDYAVKAFRWTTRFGGQPHLSAPVTPASGANTKSHFVALAARA
jgi:HK97 family phage major capsid protein